MRFPKSFVSTDPSVALRHGIKHGINSLQRLKTLTPTNLTCTNLTCTHARLCCWTFHRHQGRPSRFLRRFNTPKDRRRRPVLSLLQMQRLQPSWRFTILSNCWLSLLLPSLQRSHLEVLLVGVPQSHHVHFLTRLQSVVSVDSDFYLFSRTDPMCDNRDSLFFDTFMHHRILRFKLDHIISQVADDGLDCLCLRCNVFNQSGASQFSQTAGN